MSSIVTWKRNIDIWIKEIAGHKLSDSVIDRLPTLCTLSPGKRVSYSEVVAFHNVIRGRSLGLSPLSWLLTFYRLRNGYGRKVILFRHSRAFYNADFALSIWRIIREATAKSKDGRIDQSDFLNYAASSSRYSLFTPMEASIIFHFAGRGVSSQRLALVDFAQLLDPRWRPPYQEFEEGKAAKATTSILNSVLHSTYNFGLGGLWWLVRVFGLFWTFCCQVLLVLLEPLSSIPLILVSCVIPCLSSKVLILVLSQGMNYDRNMSSEHP